MEIFATSFTAVGTLLVIGILGFWLLSRSIIGSSVLGPLSALAIDIALPALIFSQIVTGFQPDANPLWWTLPLWWAGTALVFFILTVAGSIISRRETRREFQATLYFQNGIFFPLAILAEIYGLDSPYLVDLFLFTLFYPAFVFNVSPLFFGKKIGGDLRRVMNPVLIATVTAVAVKLLGIHVYIPEFVVSGLSLVGNMTVPLLMIVLGGNIFLDLKHAGNFSLVEMTKFVSLKNVLFPLVTLGLLMLVQPSYHIALIVLIQSAVPPITAIPIITQREGGNRQMVDQYMVASFLCSLITLPAAVLVFTMIFPGR